MSIVEILSGLESTLSVSTKKIILILDGCTDKTDDCVNNYIKNRELSNIGFEIVYTDDIWETKANNVGLKLVQTEFATIVQDDMLLLERNWDQKLISAIEDNDIFAVSGRAALDFTIKNDQFIPLNLAGREYPLGSVGILPRIVAKLMAIFKPYWVYKYLSPLSIRLTVNRGPMLFKMSHVKSLGYFDENFAPFELDDVDICCRAFREFGLMSASRPVYYKEIFGSKAQNLSSSTVSKQAIQRNSQLIRERHSDLMVKT